jgi:preprotein translocase subunit YajC
MLAHAGIAAAWLAGGFAGFSPQAITGFLPFILIIGVFYLMLIRPNQKRQQQWSAMLAALKPGDRITTTGGMRGTILSLREDAITLRLPPDNIKVEIVKSAIASVTTNEEEAK